MRIDISGYEFNGTGWCLPTEVTQVAEDPSHIPWDNTGNFWLIKSYDKGHVKTMSPVAHVVNSSTGPRLNKTNYLYCTGFNFNIPEKLYGIEVKLVMNTGGRVMEDTIQLRWNNNWIGLNRASDNIDSIKRIGQITSISDENPYWGITIQDLNTSTANLSWFKACISDPSFGIGLRFKSNNTIPHSTTPMVEYVAIRLIDTLPLSGNKGKDPGEGLDPDSGPPQGGAGGAVGDPKWGEDGDTGFGPRDPIDPGDIGQYLGSTGIFTIFVNTSTQVNTATNTVINDSSATATTSTFWPGVQIITITKLLGVVDTPDQLPLDVRYNPNASYSMGSAYAVRSTQTFWAWDGYRFSNTGSAILQ